MSLRLKHGCLLALVAASLGLTLALVLDGVRSSQAANHREAPFLALDPKATVDALLGEHLQATLMYNDKIPLARDEAAVDGKTDGANLFSKTGLINFKVPEGDGGPAFQIRATPLKLNRFKNQIRKYSNGQGDANDADQDFVKTAKQKFPAYLNWRPLRVNWKVNFKNNVPLRSKIRAVRPSELRE